MGSYLKYCKTGKEKYLKETWKKYRRLMYRKMHTYGIRVSEMEDAEQEILWNLFQAARLYDPEKLHETGYILVVIDRAVKGYLTKQNRKKQKIYWGAISLDRPVGDDENKDRSFHEYIEDPANLEEMVIVRDEIEYFCGKMKEILTPLEYDIWRADVLTRERQSDYEKIQELTGYRYKTIDNALSRIRGKVDRIRGVQREKPPELTEKDYQGIIRMREKGVLWKDIERKYNIHFQTLKYRIKKYKEQQEVEG